MEVVDVAIVVFVAMLLLLDLRSPCNRELEVPGGCCCEELAHHMSDRLFHTLTSMGGSRQ